MSHWASVKQSLLACAPVLQDSRAKLAALFTAAVTISFLVTNGSAASGTMFPSAQSPIESPPTPPATTAPPTPPPPEDTPAAEQAPPATDVEQAPPATDAEAPAQLVPPAPTQEAPPEPTQQPVPQQPRSREVRPSNSDPAGSSDLILDQAEFIDSVVVSFAYIWLCCGVALILVIPLIFLFLQIRGRSKTQKDGF